MTLSKGGRKRGRISPEDAVRRAIQRIPKGSTRTKMEVFRLALQHMNRGEEAINTGTRTVLGGALKTLHDNRAQGWHRVVGSDGSLLAGTKSESLQLRLLQAEGARPRASDTLESWLGRCGAKYVGCYKPSGSQGRLVLAVGALNDESSDAGKVVKSWDKTSSRTFLEPLRSRADILHRRRLSGGKHFWLPGETAPVAPAFEANSKKEDVPKLGSYPTKRLADGIKSKFGSSDIAARLGKSGLVVLRGLLPADLCEALLEKASKTSFEETIHLHGEAGQVGRYSFCSKPPQVIKSLQKHLYHQLVEQNPELGKVYGKSLKTLEDHCRKAGQKRSSVIFLSYGEGGENLAHQDPYGRVFFPYQAMLTLSKRGRDFRGGEFFVKSMNTGEKTEVATDQGDVTLFAANKFAINGRDFKHGVAPVLPGKGGSCKRFAVGIPFNLRQ
mmetsp:Transcript_49046/g.104406  ORF Transcript_49046/g.104406 Transcript_49046/m.104406 type:complete len:442 (+) Transcript_49046:29-1354(+)|eukprot:CAMPEP_0206457674 /NCGR_PEP_ID=MMETSP0324_2-20121206/23108_1 /ASSEMBLY_ACC=CAM_ASM_000836 /TAXON_ID=2866 /ORGANISM="Crypthecodinium cohnii, Strain Seligo" /LENGTH=441 /DNA_ID=CAMNT_0053928853 /DNA_START=24 /DNA_END=1349 /DNA_ORIENTATION=+